jgi:heat shock protein HtpX
MTQPVLVYTRIAQNRRKTLLLVAFAIASIIPFVLAVSYGVSFFIVSEVGGRAHNSRLQSIKMHKDLADMTQGFDGSSISDEMRMKEIELRREDERELATDRRIFLQIMSAVAAGLIGVLGLLFWGISSSPTAKVLALTGARPADAPEAECKRLLENLSIGAGLPPPRLYVIESSTPNAFAAGTDPKHSVVVVTRGLLQLMDHRELEGVLAHELSHITNQDTRLNTIVASIALFLRLPYLLRRRYRAENKGAYNPLYRRFQVYRLVLSPLYLYIFFVAPIMASIIRAAISRGREYLADADGALLTRYPEGLMRALAKIRGAGSALKAANPVVSHFYFGDPTPPAFSFGLFSANLLATHPPIDQRILRLAEYHGGVPPAVIEAAIKAGQQFTKDHPDIGHNDFAPAAANDELSILSVGNPMGRVCQVVGLTAPVGVLDRPDPRSATIAKIKDGDYIVVFDDPGKYRQILTADQTFGYIPFSVKLKKTDMFPNEVFGMKSGASSQAASVGAPLYTGSTADAPTPAPAMAFSAAAGAQTEHHQGTAVPPIPALAGSAHEPVRVMGLTSTQLAIAAMLFIGVFAAMFFFLTQFSGK